MAVHSISVKNLVSRVREVFPDASENYIIMLINDALVELGMYNVKNVKAKIDSVTDQMWYDLSDDAVDSSSNPLHLNKLFRVDFMDDDGDYIQVPRLIDTNILLNNADINESAIVFAGE
jgi:hypothetical protein|tara:strand:- start:278 stop:634 length:357 start_codon:yes stop_codon:yes gene_type:complete